MPGFRCDATVPPRRLRSLMSVSAISKGQRFKRSQSRLGRTLLATGGTREPLRSPSGPLVFSAGGRSRGCFGRINMRSFLSSPLVVVGKDLKLTRNRSVGHGLGSAEQSSCCFQIFLASLRDLDRHKALARFSGSWSKAIWSQPIQLRSLSLRALKRSTHFLEQSWVRHE
jgi:hypothetical protein